MKIKRILFFTQNLNSGGAERVISALANSLSSQYKIDILTLHNTPSFYSLNSAVKHTKMDIILPKNGLKRLLLIPYIEYKRLKFFVNYARKNKFDIIIAFLETPSFIACLGKLLYKIGPVVVSERNDPAALNFLMKKLISLLYRQADGLICQNEYVKNYFTKLGFKIPLPILPNPVNLQDIPNQDSLQKKREIVCVGRLAPQKNHALLIDAFSEIAPKYPNYTLKIYGSGPLEIFLKQKIADLNLTDRVFLMGTKKQVLAEVCKCDIFVLPSDFEGFPNVLIEAMALKMPVISSDFPTGIARKLIKNGENGFLFKVGDKKSLINALEKMLNCKGTWPQMGQINEQIAKQFSIENIKELWLSELQKIADTFESK